MRARIALVLGAALLVGAGIVTLAGTEKDQVFRGEIGDSQCALNVHSLSRSHAEMLKKPGVGTTEADCTRYCVKNLGGVFVLEVKDKVYKLDDQDQANNYAGQKVRVTGALDTKTNTITVHKIEPLH